MPKCTQQSIRTRDVMRQSSVFADRPRDDIHCKLLCDTAINRSVSASESDDREPTQQSAAALGELKLIISAPSLAIGWLDVAMPHSRRAPKDLTTL